MTSLRACLLLVVSTVVFAQDLRLTFDAASIKPSPPMPVGGFRPGTRINCPATGCGGPGTGSPERITFGDATLNHLIQTAYRVSPYQIEGPEWLDSGRFDIVVNVPLGATREQANLMLQNLLADRFQLKFHRSTKEVPIYALVVARNGPKLKASVADPNAPRPRGTIVSGGRKRFEFNGMTMTTFASALETDVERPVIDMTGLEGAYDIRMEFALTRPFLGSEPDPQAAALFTAVTEQLGLRLESRRGPIVVMVVDNALKQPMEN